MKEYAPGVELKELSLMEAAAPPAEAKEALPAAVPALDLEPKRASTGTAWQDPERVPAEIAAAVADRFLTKAIEEQAAGHIDQMLWARAVARAGGDDAKAETIYLQSRATALRVTKRENKAASRALVAEAVSTTPERAPHLELPHAHTVTASATSNNAGRGISRINRRRAMIAAGGALLIVAALVVSLAGIDPIAQEMPAKPRFNVLAQLKPLVATVPAATDADAAGAANPPGEDYVAKVRTLKQQGNWNVVVLYAVEWTRKEPGNANAWKELSQGYVKLRQYGEAQEAASKAVELAPEDFLQWQSLGEVNLALQLPEEALEAFHRASVLNDRDVISLVQAGRLNAQFGRLQPARAAFEKALILSPQDVQALCGATSIAHREGRVKDAQAMTREIASLNERCSDSSGTASVRVAVGQSSPDQTIP